jgi:hypothetical protein
MNQAAYHLRPPSDLFRFSRPALSTQVDPHQWYSRLVDICLLLSESCIWPTSESARMSSSFNQKYASPGRIKKGDPHKITYGSPLTVISISSFAEKNFKPLGAGLGYLGAGLFLAGHFIPAPFFNEFRSLP